RIDFFLEGVKILFIGYELEVGNVWTGCVKTLWTRGTFWRISVSNACAPGGRLRASRSNSPNGRVNASAPQQRPDWESCESQFVTLAIDFCLRRAFTGPPGTTDCGIDLPPHREDSLRQKPHRIFLSGAFSYAEDSLFSPYVGFPTIVDKRRFTTTVHFLHCESASKGSKWISSSQMTTVLPDFCSDLP